MSDRVFREWIAKFHYSIADYGYYIDFDKVYKNVESIKIELNILNSLIGSKNIESDFENILKKYPETLKCIPILLAVRENEIYAGENGNVKLYDFHSQTCTIDDYKTFMKKTGLFELLQKHIINNLFDYVTGVETGLDSNGRKNRGGHLMEDLVESYIQKAGFIRDKTYFKEMYISDVSKKWNIDLSAVSNQGKMEKRFDFVVKGFKPDYFANLITERESNGDGIMYTQVEVEYYYGTSDKNEIPEAIKAKMDVDDLSDPERSYYSYRETYYKDPVLASEFDEAKVIAEIKAEFKDDLYYSLFDDVHIDISTGFKIDNGILNDLAYGYEDPDDKLFLSVMGFDNSYSYISK